MALLQRYSLKVIFALTLLIGLQVPSFSHLYETRLDAHFQESKMQLKQYQQLADRLFEGDLSAVLTHHNKSDVALFKAEASIIEALIKRTDFLSEQKTRLKQVAFKRYFFLMTQINQPLFNETKNNYQANIVLSSEAIIFGLIIATISTLSLECIFLLFPILFRSIRHKTATGAN
ncbi:DUF2937 family protein [Psychromonas sp. KJ10-10]|uniref:DUF2937 family protein n=1 Tax=Psychromonas sp. KJ10-10 TaxID=3391823 RepID=UPI0039B67775